MSKTSGAQFSIFPGVERFSPPLGTTNKICPPLGRANKKIGKVSVLNKTHFFHGAGRGGSDPFSGTLNVRGKGRSSAYGKFQKNNIFFIETFPSKSNFPRSILGAFPILPSHMFQLHRDLKSQLFLNQLY